METTKPSRQKILDEIRAKHQERVVLAETLFSNIKDKLDIVESLAKSFKTSEPEFVYRFYHQSFKVFGYQQLVRYTIGFFEGISPDERPLNSWFRSIVAAGLASEFGDSTNEHWLDETRPVLEAFWHSKFFVEQMLSSATSLESAPQQTLPYDWATVLYLYDLR